MSKIRSFEILKLLGKGSYSNVYKVKRKTDGIIYAMKKVKMPKLLEARDTPHLLNTYFWMARIAKEKNTLD